MEVTNNNNQPRFDFIRGLLHNPFHLKVPSLVYLQTVSKLDTNTGLLLGESRLITNSHKDDIIYRFFLPTLIIAEQAAAANNG